MRKSTIAISIAAVFTAPAFLIAGSARAPSPRQQPAEPLHAPARPATPAAAVLYDQSGPVDALAQVLHDSNSSAYDSEGVDDFVVTDAEGWTVTQVNAQVAFLASGAPSPAPGDIVYDVVFYPDNAGAPGATPVAGCAYSGLSGTLDAAQNNVQVPLVPACQLPAGTYWVSYTPKYHFPPQGFWAMGSGAAINAAGRWRNPGGAYGTPCTAWSPLAACTGFEPDGPIANGDNNYLFQIVGTVNGGGGDCGSGGICLQVGLAPADPGNPAVCGTATSLDVAAGDQVNYCYKVTNDTGLTLNYQSLSDNVNGSLLNLVEETLPAGGSLQYNRVVTVGQSQSVISTWTAQDQLPGYGFTTGNLDPGTPADCSDRLFADGFDGTGLPCNGGTPGDFIDISGTGTAIDPGDDASVAATLPFSFNLYGQSSNRICVGNNGYILFGTATCPSAGLWDNQALPTADLPATAILPFWDDLYTGGHVYTATIGTAPNRKFVVEWYRKNHAHAGASDPGGVTFEVVFGEDGSLRFNYLKTTFESDASWDDGASATIGLQKNAALANAFSFDQPSLHAQYYVAATAANPTVFTSTDAGVSVNVGAPEIQLSPTSLSGSAAAGTTTTATLGVGNVGSGDLHWTTAEAPAAHLPPLGSRYAFPLGTADGPDALQKTAVKRTHKPAPQRPWLPSGATAPAFAVMPEDGSYTPLDAAAPGALSPGAVSGGSVGVTWGGGFVGGQFATEYLLGDDGLKKIDTATRAITTINASTGGGDVWAATTDPTSGAMYYVGPSSSQKLFRIDDLSTGAAVSVGSITGSASGHIVSAIAIDRDGRLWGVDKTQDTLVAIDKTTGASSLIGSLGTDTEGIASLAFDYATGKLYLAALDASRSASTMYTVDTTTGAATAVGPVGDGTQHLTALAIATSGSANACAAPADVPWLSLSPASGTTPAAGSVPVTATLDAGSLSAGAYHANICVSSNDTAHPLVAVPVAFTVTGGGNPPTLSKAFAPASVAAGLPSRLTITLANTNATAATLTAALTDTFPAGLVVAATPNASTTCGGTVTAAAGSGSIGLGAGAAIPANGSCTVGVDVQAAAEGSYANTIPAGALATSAGANAAAATATLTVTAATPVVCSAPIDHAIANTTNGTSISWISGSIVDSDPSTGYDVNLYGASSGLSMWWNNAPTANAGVAPTTSSSNYSVLTNGAVIGPASTWSRTNGAMTAFRAGVDGYFGFRFDCSALGGTTCYGYAHLRTTAATGFPATLVDYCYDRTGAAITIPGTPPPTPPTLTKAFAPGSILAGGTSTLTITLANANATPATLSAALTDTFPAGLVVAATPNASTTCGGTVNAAAGGGSVSLDAAGAAIPANGSCTVSVDVQAAAAGSYANTIPAGALATSAGANTAAATATLAVTPTTTPSCPTQSFDGVTAPALPADWVFSSGAGSGTFTTVSSASDSAPNSAFAPNLTTVNDIRLESPVFMPTAGTALTFRNRYNLENGFDGAVLEISIDGGAYQDILAAGGSFVAGGYNGTLSTNATFLNPLVGRAAWTGSTSGAFVTTTVTFPPAAVGKPTKLRFRTGDDNSTAASGTPGWWIDTLTCGAAPPTVAKAFAPSNGPVGATSTLTISLAHPAGPATLTADLVDTLPAGLVVAATPNASTTCTGGTATAVAGGGSVALNTGATIPASGCVVKVDVTTSAPGIYVNTIAAGALQTDVGNNAAAGTANYQATQPGFVTYSTGFEAPGYAAGALSGQQGWFASVSADWKVATAHPGAGAQHARGTWTTAGSGTSFMLSPTQPAGTTAYSTAAAKLAITVAGSGATWDFAPQDPAAGSVITRVRFLNSGNKIQVLDPNGGAPAYVDTGATWTPGAYFDVKVVARRADKTYEVCLNGTSIWSGTGFAGGIANVAIIGNKGTGTQNNVLDVDDVVIDNVNDGGCGGGPAPVAPTLSKAFAPASVAAGSPSTLTITLANANATAATLTAALTDTFPAGLVVAPTPNAATTCGGAVTAAAGSGSVSLGAGAAIPANGTCTVSVDVQAANAGSYANTIPTGALATGAGSNASAANATLTVTPASVAPTLSKAFAPAGVAAGNPSTLTITLANANATPATLAFPLTDTFPAGLVVAPTPNAATTCGGAVTAAAGSGSVSLGAGAAIPANGTCTVSVDVQAANAGSYANTIPTGALVTSAGSNADPAVATLTVGAAVLPPTLAASFAPKTHVSTGAATTLTLTLGNPNASPATLSAPLVDALPAGLVVAATPNAATSCSGGAVAASAGGASFSLDAGAQIPANGTCTVSVDLQSAAAGVYVNTLPAGALQTDAGSNGAAAQDSVVVAGTFPAPYCSATFSSGREPITRVDFAGIVNTSSATVGGTALENFLAVTGGAVAPRGGYAITVKGNTDGNFQDFVNVFFDWNHDGQFATDGSESVNVGSITNSTGTDSVQASNVVAVPPTAKPGLTRMRVVKAYGSYGRPCGDSGYGQAEDYLVLVDPSLVPPPAPPLVGQAFSQTYFAAPGGTSTLTITLTNYNAAPLALTAALTDTFPAGLVVAATPNAATTCPGGTLTADAGTGLVRLAAGAQIPSGSCTITVDVTSAASGIYVNTIAAGAAQSASGNSPNPTSATIQFGSTTGVPTYATGFESPFAVGALNGQQGWYGQGGSPSPQVASTTPAHGTQHASVTSTANGGTTGTQPLALSPSMNVGTSPYSVASANVRISSTTNGASWEITPQDSSTGLVVTRLQFDRAAAHDIKVITNYTTGTFTATGATWPVDTYFNIKFIVERATGALKICMNGTQIYDDPAGASVAGENVTDLAALQVPVTGQTAGNKLLLDDVVIDNPGVGTCSGAVEPLSPPASSAGGTAGRHVRPVHSEQSALRQR